MMIMLCYSFYLLRERGTWSSNTFYLNRKLEYVIGTKLEKNPVPCCRQRDDMPFLMHMARTNGTGLGYNHIADAREKERETERDIYIERERERVTERQKEIYT